MFSPDVANPAAGGLLGATIYEGDGAGACNCRFVKTYPYSFGPRIGVVLSNQPEDRASRRMGHHATRRPAIGQADGGSTLGAGGWNTFNFQSPAFGEPGALLRTGLVYNRDALFRVNNDAGIRPSPGQVDSPPQWIHPDAGKMPRLNQWSVSLQREITRDLVVDVAYVGNRGKGFTANNLINLNAISSDGLQSFGLNLNNAADRTLLTSRLDSPAGCVARLQQAAVCRLFGREHGGAEPEAVPAVRHHQRARRAARREQVRLAAGEGQQAVLARART